MSKERSSNVIKIHNQILFNKMKRKENEASKPQNQNNASDYLDQVKKQREMQFEQANEDAGMIEYSSISARNMFSLTEAMNDFAQKGYKPLGQHTVIQKQDPAGPYFAYQILMYKYKV